MPDCTARIRLKLSSTLTTLTADPLMHACMHAQMRVRQSCSVLGSAKSSNSQTFTHFTEFEKCRLEFGQSSTDFKEFVELYSMRLSKLQGTAAPPRSVPLFPCSIRNMFNDSDMNYDLLSVSGQEDFLVFRPKLSHIS